MALAIAAGIGQARAAVGTTSGKFSVSSTGAAEYVIPITAAPGSAGMQPDLSLVYSSRGRNGLLGLGWRLGGLSSITRCPATIAQDGIVDGVDLDDNDRLCLDGQRLVAVSGAYGQTGTIYRTELETFVKVTQTGALNGPNTSFTVQTKSGLTRSMGASSGGMHVGGPAAPIYVWAVDRIEDSVGNTITVAYAHDAQTNEHYVTRIDYTGNTAAGVNPYNSVRFTYSAEGDPNQRRDQATRWLNGVEITVTRRLQRITTYAGAQAVREYRLDYEQYQNVSVSSYRSKLISIQECAGGDCLPPTTFIWSHTGPDHIINGYPLGGDASFFNSSGVFSGDIFDVGENTDYSDWYFADFNGDGYNDIFMVKKDHGDKGANRLYFNSHTTPVDFDTALQDEIPQSVVDGDDELVLPGDFNGDGGTDILVYDRDTDTGNFYEGGPNGLTPIPANQSTIWPVFLEDPGVMRVANINGDGLADLLWYNPSKGRNFWLINRGNYHLGGCNLIPNDEVDHGNILVRDFDGDGLTDALFFDKDNGTTRFYHNWPADAYPVCEVEFGPMVENPIPANEIDGDDGRLYIGDFNGDGLPDILWTLTTSSGINRWYINQDDFHFQRVYAPDGNAPIPPSVIASSGNFGGFFIADFNGDGLDDAMWAPSNFDDRMFINGGQLDFTMHSNTIGTPLEYASPSQASPVVDLNADGYPEFLYYDNSGSNSWSSSAINIGAKPEHIVTIENGLGAEIKIRYAPLTDPDVYTPGTGAVFPVQDFTAPLRVVVTTETEQAAGGFSEVSYDYGGARVNVHGRGFLGFAWRASTDDSSQMREKTVYAQNFPYTGMPTWVETTNHITGAVIATADTLLATKTLGSGATQRWFPYVDVKTTRAYNLASSQAVKTTVADKAYDNYGNVTTLTQTSYAGATPAATFVTETVNVYTNDVAAWHLGRLTHTTVTKTLPNGDAATRNASFAYEPTTGLLSDETIEPGSPFALHTHYQYDTFGNVQVTTVSGADIATRSSVTNYDARGQFVDTTTNALGHVSHTNYSDAHGGLLSQTGPNGLTTSYGYDAFGRQTSQTRPDGSWTHRDYLWHCGAFNCGPIDGAFTIRSTASDGSASSAIFDLEEQPIASTAQGFAAGDTVFTFTVYDGWGRKQQISQPALAASLSTAYNQALWTDYDYDILDRPKQIDAPAANGARSVTDFDYQGLTVTKTNDHGQPSVREENAIGQLVRVTDALGNSTTYEHYPFGNLKKTTDAAGNQITMAYDIRGHKTAMTDPDLGHWTYDYNVLGQVKSQTDAKGQTVTFAYDQLGRMTQRSEAEGVTTWTYDQEWLGAVDSVRGPGIEKLFDYDSLGRSSQTVTIIGGQSFSVTRSFDSQSRLQTLTYPTGFAVEYAYTATGYLHKVTNASTNALYWQADAMDAYGGVSLMSLGNGLSAMRQRDVATGAIDTVTVGALGNVLNLGYEWGSLGNLAARHDNNQSVTETFGYDELNRLKQAKRNNSINLSVTYNAIGNILTKSNVGTYAYGAGNVGPHAVTSVTGPRAATYTYDANGNMTQGGGRTITWTSYNKPQLITGSNGSAEFSYGPDRARYRQIATYGLTEQANTYIGKLYEQRRSGAAVVDVQYVLAAGTAVAQVTTTLGASTTRYLHRDHLGSVVAITDEQGNRVERIGSVPFFL